MILYPARKTRCITGILIFILQQKVKENMRATSISVQALISSKLKLINLDKADTDTDPTCGFVDRAACFGSTVPLHMAFLDVLNRSPALLLLVTFLNHPNVEYSRTTWLKELLWTPPSQTRV